MTTWGKRATFAEAARRARAARAAYEVHERWLLARRFRGKVGQLRRRRMGDALAELMRADRLLFEAREKLAKAIEVRA